MLDLALLLTLAFVVYFFAVLRPTGLLTANSLFVYVQMVMALGTLPRLDETIQADVAYSYIVTWSTISYMAVSGLATLHRPPDSKRMRGVLAEAPSPQAVRPPAAVFILVVASLGITLAYFIAIGYSTLLQGLQNSISGGSADIAGLRLDAYSGERYLYPGYVNQFKNVLLPALIVVIFTHWVKTRRTRPVLMAALTALALFGLLGTGQRGAFIQFAIAAGVYLYLFNGNRFPKGALRLGVACITLFGLATFALGRSNAGLDSSASPISRAVAAFKEIPSRIIYDQQYSAIAGFRYIYDRPIEWGEEWLQGLLGLLPGRGGSDLSNQIFATLYGSDRGTSPPSIWGSIYHNFGITGVAVFPAVLALILVSISRQAMCIRGRNSMELVGISGASTTLGLWAAGSPDYLFNSGLAVYLFLWLWGTSSRSFPRDGTTPALQTLRQDKFIQKTRPPHQQSPTINSTEASSVYSEHGSSG